MPSTPETDPRLAEILRALDLPYPHGVELFLNHIHAFCQEHGGARYYSELLELVSECDGVLGLSRKQDGGES